MVLFWPVYPLRPCIWNGNAFSWVWGSQVPAEGLPSPGGRCQEQLLDATAAVESGSRNVWPGVPPAEGKEEGAPSSCRLAGEAAGGVRSGVGGG